MLNYRQSGPPRRIAFQGSHAGRRCCSPGAMRWDIRRPWLRFGDRFVLAGGSHRAPRLRHARGAERVAAGALRARAGDRSSPSLTRAAGRSPGRTCWVCGAAAGCPGMPRWAARRLFLKFNTGPSGHGHAAGGRRGAGAEAGRRRARSRSSPSRARAASRPARRHETKNTAWGLGLSTTWSSWWTGTTSGSTPGRPRAWWPDARSTGSRPYGWRVTGHRVRDGVGAGDRTVLEAGLRRQPRTARRRMAWFRTRKGRGLRQVRLRPATARPGR